MRAHSAVATATLTALALGLSAAASATPAPSPAVVVTVAAVDPGEATAPTGFVPLGSPRPPESRDTRETPGTGTARRAPSSYARPLSPGEGFTVPFSGGQAFPPREFLGVPAGATAAVVEVTVTNTTEDGYLTLRADTDPSGTSTPSVLNFRTGETVSLTVTVALAPRRVTTDPQISVFGHAGRADVVVDVLGYHVGGTAPRAGGTVAGRIG